MTNGAAYIYNSDKVTLIGLDGPANGQVVVDLLDGN
jgi:hypothetical protein